MATQGFRLVRTPIYTDDAVLLSSSYRKMQGLLETVKRYAATVGMRTKASKTKVMLPLTFDEQPDGV